MAGDYEEHNAAKKAASSKCIEMIFDCFYKEQSSSMHFTVIPKVLIAAKSLWIYLPDAKLLYGLLLTELSLSSSRWLDEYRRVYIILHN